MRRKAGFRLLLVALLATFALACGSSGSKGTEGQQGPADAGPSCPICLPSQVCFSGSCYDTSCADQECPPDAVCSNGDCVSTSCLGTTCQLGYLCAAGACQPTACGATPCAANEVCYDGSCVTPDCFGVACPAGYLCAQGSCEPGSCGSTSCDGGVCSSGACIQAACFGITCPSGQSCANGGCWLSNCPNAQCPQGDVCSWNGNCVSAACAGVWCPTGSLCAGPAGACQPTSCGTTPCPTGQVCDGTGCVQPDCFGVNCPSGFLCAAGSCESTVCGTTPCATGDVCDDGTCTQAACFGVSCPPEEGCANGGCYPTNCANQNCTPPDVCPFDQCEDPSCVAVPCPAGTICAGGTCQPTSDGGTPCPTGQAYCGGACVSPSCCDFSCPFGQVCANGACYSRDVPGPPPTPCPGNNDDVYCVDSCIPGTCVGVICPSDLCTALGCSPGPCNPPPKVGGISAPPITGALDQLENNGSLAVLTWPDGGGVEGVEVVAHTIKGGVVHVRTDQSPTRWYPSGAFSGSAECGVAVNLTFAGPAQAEVFTPSPAKQTQSLSYQGGWRSFQSFAGRGITQLSTLRWADDDSGGWNDGRLEVFGLNGNGRIYFKWFNPSSRQWVGWETLGSSPTDFATGASAILDAAGYAVVFAVDRELNPWFNRSTGLSGDRWSGWKAMGGHLTTRPVVVRDRSGTLHVFGRGTNGWLYTAHSTATGFSGWAPIQRGFRLAGAPAAAIDNGTVAVFVRDTTKLVHYSTLGSTGQFGSFKQLSTTKFASDPFAWQLPAGGVELFAVDETGHLQASYHYSTRWASWTTLASGVDACPVPLLTPQCPNGDGLYCGGHGVAGTKGSLYSCTGGTLSLEDPCPNGCESLGKGGNDQCGCGSNGDCAQCEVCLQQALMCVSGSGVTGNNCTANLDNTLGMACTKDSDCDPCGASDGGIVCTSCALLPTNTCAGSCCQFGG